MESDSLLQQAYIASPYRNLTLYKEATTSMHRLSP